MSAEVTSSRSSRPLTEWLVGSISGALVGILLLFLAYQAVFSDSRPPDLAIAVERIEPIETGSLIAVTIANRGDRAAAEVTVRAISTAGGNEVQKTLRFDYVAGQAVRRGAFIFSGQVPRENIRFAIDGYSEP